MLTMHHHHNWNLIVLVEQIDKDMFYFCVRGGCVWVWSLGFSKEELVLHCSCEKKITRFMISIGEPLVNLICSMLITEYLSGENNAFWSNGRWTCIWVRLCCHLNFMYFKKNKQNKTKQKQKQKQNKTKKKLSRKVCVYE